MKMAFKSNLSQINIYVKTPPQKRTIFISGLPITRSMIEDNPYLFLQFPEMIFLIDCSVKMTNRGYVYTYISLQIAFVVDGNYCLPPLPNIFQNGDCCLHLHLESTNLQDLVINVLNNFWTSAFNSWLSDFDEIGVREQYVDHWNTTEILTYWKHNPNPSFLKTSAIFEHDEINSLTWHSIDNLNKKYTHFQWNI